MIRLCWGSATDKGRVRAMNEDALLAEPPMFVVADGMGGHSAGDVASGIVIGEFRRLAVDGALTTDRVRSCLSEAHSRILAASAEEAATTMGSTVAGLAMITEGSAPYWLIFNVGDSRVYRAADGKVEQISVDHSVVQELMDAGQLTAEDARRHPERHVITRALGTSANWDPEFWMLPVVEGERYLVCSDGLSAEVSAEDICAQLVTRTHPADVASALITAAVEAGGRDNVTAVVVDVLDGSTGDAETTIPNWRVNTLRDEITIPRPPVPPKEA